MCKHHLHHHPQLPPCQHLSRNHDEPEHSPASRRDFLRLLMGTTLTGASVLELAYHRAAWAAAAAPPPAHQNLFTLSKVANNVYFAFAHPQAMVNCNAAIFVRSADVVVVDAHSKPSAAAALLAQLKREVTSKPVRFLINTHFHWDHMQGDAAYLAANPKLEIVATATTRQLMQDQSLARLKASLDEIPPQIEELKKRAANSTIAAEKAFCNGQIRQLEAYQSELKDFKLELPTVTFDKSHVLTDKLFDLHLGFHGHAHTAGDAFVYAPHAQALATGDASHGWLPNLADGFPRGWPRTIDEVKKLDFKFVLGGHGPAQPDRVVMTCQRNYIEELAQRVAQAKQAGQSLDEMKKRITVDSLRSMHSNNYAATLARSIADGTPHFGPLPPLQDGVNENITHTYANLDKV